MISDRMLSAAAAEVSDAVAASISEREHSFSAEFELQMAKLRRSAAHPVRRQVMRYSAAMMLVAITVFGSLYLLSPSARATMNSWVRTTFGSYIQYYSDDTTPPELEYDYFLPEEIDGYFLNFEKTVGSQFFSIYTNSQGQMLSFNYVRGSDNTSMFLMDIENHNYHSGAVGPYNADIYISDHTDHASIIVWHDPEDNVLFCISAFATKDELLAFAEKMEKTEKIPN